MKCEQFERRLDRLLDQRIPPAVDAALRAHASACPSCQETLDIQELLLDRLATLDDAYCSAAVAGRLDIVANRGNRATTPLGSKSPISSGGSASSVRLARWSVLAICASMVCIFAGWQWLQNPVTTETQNRRGSRGDSPAESNLALAAQRPDYSALPDSWSPEVAPFGSVAVSHTWVGYQLVSQTDWAYLVPFSKSMGTRLGSGLQPEWRERVAGSVQPLTDSVNSAIHILKRTLPMGQTTSHTNDPQAAANVPPTPPSIWA